MSREWHIFFEIVHIIHMEAQSLSLFEFVSKVKGSDPLWVQVIHDDFGASKFDPLATNI